MRERPVWYSSFYWRIAISFVLFVAVVLVGESLMVSYMASRPNNAFSPGGNPNIAAAVMATDIGSALANNPQLNLEDYLRRTFPNVQPSAFVVMKDGRVARSTDAPLPDAIQRQTEALLAGVSLERSAANPGPPVVTAPIQVGQELKGMVVLPPPPDRGMFGDVWRMLSLPGTLVLIVVTVVAAVVIFAPARRRLHALEKVADRFRAGDLDARAPESGRDEIARVAGAFNRMAAELSARNEALRAAERQRRQMLADVSHELRTPLTTMRGYLDTLDMPDVSLDAETRSRYLDTVRHETGRLERIVLDLLDLARYESGAGAFDVRVFAIERMFMHVVRRHERDATHAGIELCTHVAESADQLVADPDRIEQAVDNLVANAMRHTPAGGTIELRATATSDACRLSVIDSGTGIAPEHLEHVFDRFYKVDASRAAGPGGSGLGLSIVKAIAERHGGTITVSSGPGHTEFVITVPQRSIDTPLEVETGRAAPRDRQPGGGTSANL